ncbi:triphosphoribosyl-dephospho-CoA synthase [Xanthobacter sp. DSM 24535]|uniref:triphosphoribosyl-dephospho-CoA synthase n=1 Tax=Roseixanthobacter psychrophilus TaxID=3119917 RepID=UPI0037278BEF
MTPDTTARLFEAVCLAELHALKPGNVHVHAGGHGMEVAQFERAAAAAAPAIATPGLGIGARIEAAVSASLAAAGCNTNLGIILLCAPLIQAAQDRQTGPLRERVEQVLDALTVEDAACAFRAITAANPGGLGTAPADVRAPTTLNLKAAMAQAEDRDRIAFQYTHGFADIFHIGTARLRGSSDPTGAEVVQALYLDFLSAFPDSHISRKFGLTTAEGVRAEARRLVSNLAGATHEARHVRLLAFDADLKARGLNPGTSADLTVASLLAHLLEVRAHG